MKRNETKRKKNVIIIPLILNRILSHSNLLTNNFLVIRYYCVNQVHLI